jgi:hypothetical protein
MASAVRSDAGGSVIGFAVVFVSFVFRSLIPGPTWVWFVVLAVGVLLAVKDGISGLDVVTLGLAGFMIVGPLISGAHTATTDAADLEEPIPVPSGYGFELDPRSTNREHFYRSGSMPLERAQSAAVEVIDNYVDALAPEWTVIDREERPPDLSMVELRQGDSSRGISIFVGVVEPFGRPAFLDLRIQALLCREGLPSFGSGEVSCMGAPISQLVRYPGGEPVVPSPQPSPGPLREPVPVPSGYGFSVNTGLTSEDVHAYSSAIMSIPEARRAERLVLRYYRQALDDWIIVAKDQRNLLIKDPDSTDGLAIEADWSVWDGEDQTGIVELEIRAITCSDDYSCNWRSA